MSFGILDSTHTRRGYVVPELDAIWSERRSIETWYEVEAALARAQADLGMIPREAADAIAASANVTDELVEKISYGGLGNPLVVGLDEIRGSVPDEVRGWVHYGATTQDILDTSRALQIRESLDFLLATLDELVRATSELASTHASTLMIGRTNGQQALPTTLGARFARWRAALERDRRRLTECREDAISIQFSGAGGTYASMGENGPKVARKISEELGLTFDPIPWHGHRDKILAMVCAVAIHGQTLGKISDDLFDMQRTEIGEAIEAMDAHTSGSSAMPQKRNPFATMKVAVAGQLAAGSAAMMLTQPPAAHERDHRQLEVERDVVPRVLVAVGGASRKLLGLLGRLRFVEEALAANAEREGILVVTEGILMALAPHVGHETAHDVLQEFVTAHRETGVSLRDFVTARPELGEVLDAVDLESVSTATGYLGLSEQIARGDEMLQGL